MQKLSRLQMSSTGQSCGLTQVAQRSLGNAISSERAKQWDKAIEHYKKLLRILNTIKISEKGEMDPSFKQLLYETYYHLGIAFQNVNRHEEAVLQYTKALQASSIHKKNCAVGCTIGTCLHTPVLTRRAFALAKCGETRKVLKDADAAVFLDRLNPDVYCIRALVWCTMQKEKEAIKDLDYGLRINPSHACSLILRGNIKKYMSPENNSSPLLNDDHEKALQINYSSIRFLGIKDFNHPEISAFYDSLLWSLNVPHTVISVRLPSACWTAQSVSFHLQRTYSAPVPRDQSAFSFDDDQHKASFCSGATTENSRKFGLERRLNYGRAVTAYIAGLKGNRIPAMKNIDQFCEGSTVCLSTQRSSIQKRYGYQKMLETTGFSVYEISHPGTMARMYNKPWNGDKLPNNLQRK
ncbi:uncharacterized protein LOC130369116 isoform X2 [Hyla sarda]|uniref:uncharacterized protein LOC130369116 isoform X2 n=1 Tax=Hyla sarda TaxID=327740 RepID=UPI0024C32A0B|nr:uncharacterized protein LOC130369116 isoform X2 [Hyla sarda]